MICEGEVGEGRVYLLAAGQCVDRGQSNGDHAPAGGEEDGDSGDDVLAGRQARGSGQGIEGQCDCDDIGVGNGMGTGH